jgi:hypothetical protein
MIAKFIKAFLDSIQQGTQERFIKQAEKKGAPSVITTRLRKIDQEAADITNLIRNYKK